MSRRSSAEIVHEGWLTKSPPSKRIWRAKWRRRWFVLKQSGELPGQYVLEYFADKQCLKLKGRVDLDQCVQVDAGLQFQDGKLKYLKHLFDLHTPKRTYYLAADTEDDMNKWVDCVCQVCGLKASDNNEENYYDLGPPLEEPKDTISIDTTSTSISTTSTNTSNNNNNHSFAFVPIDEDSSPDSTQYILMSECYSGKAPPNIELELRRRQKPVKAEHMIQMSDTYDAPKRIHTPAALDLIPSPRPTTPPLQSPGTDSVFLEDEWPSNKDAVGPGVNWSTFPRESSTSDQEPNLESSTPKEIGAWSVARRFSKINIQNNEMTEPPPRPPKPSHLAEPIHGYLNLSLQPGDPGAEHLLGDDMYDFPRSHNPPQNPGGPNCYTNAAPSSAGNGKGIVFTYDFSNTPTIEHTGEIEPSTPKSENGSINSPNIIYSNLPSPAPPPTVNRGLKPGRRLSDSMSNEPSPSPCSPAAAAVGAPSVDRKLKPRKVPESPKDPGAIPLAPAPTLKDVNMKRKQRAAPSPTPPGCAPSSPAAISVKTTEGSEWSCSEDETRFRDSGDEEANFYYIKDAPHGRKRFDKVRFDKVKYLDLDHDTMVASTKSPKKQRDKDRSTIYNTVDFLKTSAFNATRETVERERQNSSASSTAVS